MNFYNEFDPKAAEWLRALIKAGLIAPGEVDTRSIKEVQPSDLRGFAQCHFFAGISGWSYALRLAGWADDAPVWTGSCPCQPYSSAGKQKGNADDRNLWPEFYRLIAECRPDTVFGEQVESAIRHGWLDGVQADLEREGYAVGHCVLGAHSVGAPHIRQRLYWVADAGGEQPHGAGSEGRGWSEPTDGSGLGDAHGPGLQERIGDGRTKSGPLGASPWEAFELASCRDGKARRVAPGVPLLAHGIPGRVAQLRGLGNAICPQTAAAFIEAYLEASF